MQTYSLRFDFDDVKHDMEKDDKNDIYINVFFTHK